jgi:hypothetical protein
MRTSQHFTKSPWIFIIDKPSMKRIIEYELQAVWSVKTMVEFHSLSFCQVSKGKKMTLHGNFKMPQRVFMHCNVSSKYTRKSQGALYNQKQTCNLGTEKKRHHCRVINQPH